MNKLNIWTSFKSWSISGANNWAFKYILLSAMVSGSIGTAVANPEDGVVKAGEADIRNVNPSTLVIDQRTARAAIDWKGFSIDSGETVNINQPSSSSTLLNRVTGDKLSNIRGQLNANGNVILVNPNGIVLGRGSLVDVNSLIATTSNIQINDFMSDRLTFAGSGDGQIVNEGEISVSENGLVALVAPNVSNNGIIRARLGRVALASGNKFTVDLYGDGLVSLAVDDNLSRSLVKNSGSILADGGTVALTTSAAKGVVDNVINMDGIISAKSVSERGGKIVLHGSSQGQVLAAGKLDVSGDSSASSKGGLIEVLGKDITIENQAQVLASGTAGGGEIFIGGDFQGQGDRLKSDTTVVKQGAQLEANATGNGNGGQIVLWSEKSTLADGTISAVGGSLGGNGGSVETSSAGLLSFSNRVDVSASNGSAGSWLIDPEDITIGRSEADSIEATLNDGGSVSIATSSEGDGKGDITVAASITKTEGGDAALALTAHNDVNINAPITSQSGALDVKLTAGNSVKVNASVVTNGGSFTSHINPALAALGDTSSDDESEEQANEAEETEEVVEVEAQSEASETETFVAEDSGQSVAEGVIGEVNEVEAQPQLEPEAVVQQIVIDEAVVTSGGAVVVDATTKGSVSVNANVDTTNSVAGEVGGDVFVTGDEVTLTNSASIDTSGDSGGGRVLIGGGFQGDGEIASSTQTVIQSDAQIVANATTEGNAGQVVVWSDGITQFDGSITANGGSTSGDAGQIEVSGKQVLRFNGVVDATAENGNNGSLLLDPITLTITNSPSQIDNNAVLPGLDNANQEVSVLSWEQIQDLGDIDLLIRTGEDLNIAAIDGGEVVLPQSADLTSGRTIAFLSDNGDIVFAERTDVVRTSGGDLQFGATNGSLDLGVLITDNPESFEADGSLKPISEFIAGGSVTLQAGDDISVNRVQTTGGDLVATAGGDFFAGGAEAIASENAAIDLAARSDTLSFVDDEVVFPGVESIDPADLQGGFVSVSGALTIDANSISVIGNGDAGFGSRPIAELGGDLPGSETLPTVTLDLGAGPASYYLIGAISSDFNLTATEGINGVFSFPDYTNRLIEEPSLNAGLSIEANGSAVDLTAAQLRELLAELSTSATTVRGENPERSKIFGQEILLPGLGGDFLFYTNADSTNNHPVSAGLGFRGEDLLSLPPPTTPPVVVAPPPGTPSPGTPTPLPTPGTPTPDTNQPVFIVSGEQPAAPAVSVLSPAIETEQTVSPSAELTITAAPDSTSTSRSESIAIEGYAGSDRSNPCVGTDRLAWIGYAVKSAIDVAYMGRGDPSGAVDSVFDKDNCF